MKKDGQHWSAQAKASDTYHAGIALSDRFMKEARAQLKPGNWVSVRCGPDLLVCVVVMIGFIRGSYPYQVSMLRASEDAGGRWKLDSEGDELVPMVASELAALLIDAAGPGVTTIKLHKWNVRKVRGSF